MYRTNPGKYFGQEATAKTVIYFRFSCYS